MQEIADQGHIEEDSLIQYIIDGVQDDDCNKIMLYNAGTIRELKKCFEIYDRAKEKRQRRKTAAKKDGVKNGTKDTTKSGPRSKPGAKSTDKKHCFNCGSTEHDVKNCTNADKRLKCFKCNNYGHITSKCSKKSQQQEASIPMVNCVNSTTDKFVPVNIVGLKYHALINTGSDVSLIRNNVYEKIGK